MRIPESCEEEEDWERQDKLMKQQELLMKDKCRENRNKIIDTLTDENIKHLVEENNEHLEAIVHGDVSSWRQSKYDVPVPNSLCPRIGEPFTMEQFNLVRKLVHELFADREHVQAVLLPEMLIKIYKDFLGIESRTKAEEMIKNIGSLPSEDDLSFSDLTK